MTPQLWLEKTEAMVKEQFAADATGHDWPHIRRVRDLAVRFGEWAGKVSKTQEYMKENATLSA